MKKFVKLFAFVLGLVMLQIGNGSYAYSMLDLQNGTALSNNVWATGSVSESVEEKCFRFTVTQSGYLTISVKPAATANLKEINGWNIKLLDKNGNVYVDEQYKVSFVSCKLGLTPGEYYIVVSDEHYITCEEPFDVSYSFTASDSWEAEPNDTDAAATTISLNKKYTGSTHEDDTADWFKFDVPKTGNVTLNFGINPETETSKIDWGWTITLLDSNSKKIYKKVEARSGFSSFTLPLAAGSYKLSITSNSYYGPTGCLYDLTLGYDVNPSWEKENNDTFKTATSITDNSVKYGILYEDADEETDVFKYTVKSNGYTDFYFDIVDKSALGSYTGFNIKIQDKNGKTIKSYNNVRLSFKESFLTIGKGIYYVLVSTGSSDAVGVTYGIKMTRVKSDSWEIEDNNIKGKATAMSVGSIKKGVILYSDDYDWYKISVPATGNYNFGFKIDDISKSNTTGSWDVFLYRKNGATEVCRATLTKGFFKSVKLTKGDYYVKVERSSNYTNAVYDVTLTNSKKPLAPVLTKVTSAKKIVTLTWKKSANANKYEIYRSTKKNGGFKKIDTVYNDAKYVDNNAPKGKTCYYKIVAVNDSLNKEIKSSFSKVKSVKVK